MKCSGSFVLGKDCVARIIRTDTARYDVIIVLVLVLALFFFVLQNAVFRLRARGRRRVRKTIFNCQHSSVGNYRTKTNLCNVRVNARSPTMLILDYRLAVRSAQILVNIGVSSPVSL